MPEQMRLSRAYLLLLMLALCTTEARSQRLGVAYYDLGGLYDTIPSPFYDDESYTPAGRLRWNTARYRRGVDNFASVIDSMALPLVALGGVENEGVVRDLAAACGLDYTYLHHTLNTLDGLDVALLYYGDRFYPDRTQSGSGWLRIDGELDGRPATLLICGRRARYLEEEIASVRELEPQRRIIVAGSSPGVDPSRYGLRDAQQSAARSGYGNVRYRSGWRMADRILADTAWRLSNGGVYARPRMFDLRTGSPLPLYERGRFRGGFSDRLPVFTYLFPVSDE